MSVLELLRVLSLNINKAIGIKQCFSKLKRKGFFMKLYVNEIIRTNNFEDDDMMNKILGMWDSFIKIMIIIKGSICSLS